MPRKPSSPARTPRAKSGHADGDGANTDRSRTPARPVDEEDIFGGAERAQKGKDVKSDAAKP